MFIVATLVLLTLVVLWIVALYRTPRDRDEAEHRRVAQRWVIGGGLLLPGVSVVVLLAFGVPLGRPPPLVPGAPPLKIEVTGRQWRWEVRYPQHGLLLVDRLVIPVGRPLEFHVGSGDVIHSFWIPRLGGKIDAIPGRTNVLQLRADRAGRYRGQCAEFCGERHAHMALAVVAIDADAFDDWIEAQR
jgi:cytochrome c oxidase subunit 2